MTTVPALTDEAALAQYVATGGQTDFNFSYMIFATADIEVYVNGVLKTETTHYTVKKSGGGSISASDLPLDGGKVVFVSGLTADDEVSLNRNIAIARLTGYSVAGAFRADVVNAEFTKALAISQQLRRDIERSVRLAAFDAEGGSLVIPTNRASKLLGFDADGDIGLFAGIADQEVPVSAFMATVLDDADASSALTTLGISTFIKTLLDDTSASAARSTLGLVIGTNVQAYNANLQALAGLVGAANKIPYFTGAGAMALADLFVKAPAITVLTSGSGNYSTPAGTSYLEVIFVGGGGGGGGSSTGGSAGGDTSFNSVVAKGGNQGQASQDSAGGTGGTGGTGTADIRLQGADGNPVFVNATYTIVGGGGGSAFFGGGAPQTRVPSSTVNGVNGKTNTGGGGGGGNISGNVNKGSGGGGGESVLLIIPNPSGNYAYSVGAGGAGGTGTATGGNGGSGIIIIKAY